MKDELVTVATDGKLFNTVEGNLQQGDIVVLQTGDIVPADLQLVEARGLRIDEFDITGEIMPVRKKTNGDVAFIYEGSRVVSGTGKGKVVAAGEQTEYGRILKQEREQIQPYRFTIFKIKYLGLIGLLLPAFAIHYFLTSNGIAVIVLYFFSFVFLTLLQNDELFFDWLLSHELNHFKRLKIQIRDRQALRILSNIDTIGFDKTGVLTVRELDVKQIAFPDQIVTNGSEFKVFEGRRARLVIMACGLCHDVNFIEKMALANPVDQALIAFAASHGFSVREVLSQSRRVFDLPFDSENRYMACGFEFPNRERYYFAKGDPEVILRKCNRYLTATGLIQKLDADIWHSIQQEIDLMDQSPDTIIALAYGLSPEAYTFLSLLQLENSLQPGVPEIIRKIKDRGIRSIMLTGDRVETALHVSEACGITNHSKAVLSGKAIDKMGLSELARQSSFCSVFARLTPSQKGILVRLFQQNGHSIAVVGDGPNDGIALKAADIGISFVKNSSPIARRLANILINDLGDVGALIEGARRMKTRDRQLKKLRIVLMIASLTAAYIWILH